MYIDSSDVCQEVLKMFNLETYFIIKIEEMFSNKKKKNKKIERVFDRNPLQACQRH
jgi:hypothetical protein